MILGIDVSKTTLDIYNSTTKKSVKIKNTGDALGKYINEFAPKVENVFYEPTGIYSLHVTKKLNDLSLSHYLIPGYVMASISKGLSDRNKTDKQDAKKIAEVGSLLYTRLQDGESIKLTLPNSNDLNFINNILMNIESLKKIKVSYKQTIDKELNNAYSSATIINIYTELLATIEEKIQALYMSVALLIQKDQQLAMKLQNLMTIPGISSNIGIELLAFFSSLQSKGFERNDIGKVKAYTGLDCIFKQSGTSMNRKGISKRGNGKIRSHLYLSALVRYSLMKHTKYATTHLGSFFNKMIHKFGTSTNKHGKSVMCAMAKKLLITARSIFCSDTQFNYSLT